MLKAISMTALLAALLLSSCSTLPNVTPVAPTETAVVIPPQPAAPTATAASPAIQPPVQTAPAAQTLAPTEAPTTGGQIPAAAPTEPPSPEISSTIADISAQKYIDDRSTAPGLLASLFNAINRKEYLRAYSYWEPGGQISGTSYNSYRAGFSNTQSVQIVIGKGTQDEGAGQQYFTYPVGMTVQNTDGSTQKFVACYVLHLGSPSAQATLPFQSLGIQKGQAKLLASGVDPASQLGSYCTAAGLPTGHSLLPLPAYAAGDISASRYLDDRSDAVQLIRSYYNAINRMEYTRAYSYWEPAAAKQQLATLDAFSKGYANTKSVKLTTGQETSSSGAGQNYQTVPVILVAQTTAGQTQTFIGCYTMHLSNPSIQGVPPFQPLGITNAKLKQVDNGTATSLEACQ